MTASGLHSGVIHEPIERFDQAVAFLMHLVRDDPRPYQARAALAAAPVRALLARLGDPHADLPVVHIAGSKGKGSTAIYLESILQAAGMRTATFTSPHLQRWTERLRIHGRESTPAEFAALLARLQPHVLDLLAEDAATAPSFFDTLTAAALLMFAEAAVDCAIVEAGIGGRLDATNVVRPKLACITSVELEHTDKLGTSLAAIAGEKAGIIKAGTPLLLGTLPAEAESVMRARAAELDADVSALGREIAYLARRGADGTLEVRISDAQGEHRAVLGRGASECHGRNAALAMACAARVTDIDAGSLQRAMAEALARTRPAGRMEIVSERPWVVIDGAHTRASSQALAEMLAGIPARRIFLLVSLSAARNAGEVLAPLLARAHRVVATSADAQRSLDSARLAADLVAAGCPAASVHTIADPHAAVRECRHALAGDDLLCVAGSMYMAGVARETLLGGSSARRHAP